MSGVVTRLVRSFDDPSLNRQVWDQLLSTGDTDASSLTWQAQRLWWQDHQRPGALMLVIAERNSSPIAIAPMFVEQNMALNLCPVTALDFVGDISDAEVLDALLQRCRDEIPNFVGFRFYFVPHTSRTANLLKSAADRLSLSCYLEDEQPSPYIDLRGKREAALECTRKKTLVRRESYFRRNGTLEIQHFRHAQEVLPQLDQFFEQHILRWRDTPTPSRFHDVHERESFARRTEELATSGWLRFSRLDWNGRPIAFHRGTCYKGHYKYSRATFAPDLDRLSPGTVLLRQLMLAALEEGAHTFDFGLGDEAYKFRYATDSFRLQTWGLYPRADHQDVR